MSGAAVAALQFASHRRLVVDDVGATTFCCYLSHDPLSTHNHPLKPHPTHTPPPTKQKMKELAVYLMLVLGGNATPSAAEVKAAAEAAGVVTDDGAVEQVLAAVAGKDLDAVVAEGRKKLVNIGGGGAAPAAAAAGAAAPAAGGAAAKKEEEKKEEEEEVGGAGGLFGDDDEW